MVINIRYTFARAANATTNGVALGVADQDILVYKLIIGLPVASGVVRLYNKTVAYSTDTSDLAFEATLPATITYQWTTANGAQTQFDFGPQGLQLNGGNLQIDQAMQVTVIWEPKDEAQG